MTSTIQGIAVSPTPPTAGQILALTGGVYTPSTPNPGDITAVNTTLPLTGGATSGAVTLDIDNFTGDSGAGGLDGAVPAPAAGDAAAGKFLKADGVWAVPPAGGVTVLANIQDNAQQTFNTNAYVVSPGMTATVSCTAGKKQEVNITYDIQFGPTGATYTDYVTTGLFIDGVQVCGRSHVTAATTYQYFSGTISYIATGLSAGNHTFDFRVNANSAKTVFLNTEGSLESATIMTVKEF